MAVTTVYTWQTVAGGFIFIIFRLVFFLLLAWNIKDIASRSTTIIPGDRVVLNVNQNADQVPAGSHPVMDVPTLEFSIDHTIYFYEAKYPTIQSIEVQDMTGYNPRYLSDMREVPIAQAMYQAKTIDLDAWDEATQVVKSPNNPVIGDLYSATVDDALHGFSDSMKVFYKEGRVYGEVRE